MRAGALNYSVQQANNGNSRRLANLPARASVHTLIFLLMHQRSLYFGCSQPSHGTTYQQFAPTLTWFKCI